ncbi:hypothetical protein [Geothrix sp. SG200]|uniref:hypothetical protein n=1 Tax=Geothrix sp. SG200 TaxID=2922865 RepID=UPI001FAE5D37|nr:hypothetical protein [Geothrix sp. SG200]
MSQIMRSITIALAAATAAPVIQAQDFTAVRGMGQAMLPAVVHLHENDTWGGTMFLTLDGKEMLVGVFSGQDGEVTWHGPEGLNGNGKGGTNTFAFNLQPDGTYKDTFTTFVVNGSFPSPKGQLGFGNYQGSHRIVSGTGRFANASGTLLLTGTFVWFPLAGGTQELGYFNPEVSGVLTNVAPPE